MLQHIHNYIPVLHIQGQTSEWTSTSYGYRQLHTVRHLPCITCAELIELVNGNGFCCSGFCIPEPELFFRNSQFWPSICTHAHIHTPTQTCTLAHTDASTHHHHHHRSEKSATNLHFARNLQHQVKLVRHTQVLVLCLL